jgi:hypothetical protein
MQVFLLIKFITVGRTIINNYIGKEGIITNTIGNDNDPDKKDTPDRSNRWIIVAISVLASLATIITFIVQGDYKPHDTIPNNNTTNHNTNIKIVPPPAPNTKGVEKDNHTRSPKKEMASVTAPFTHTSLDRSTLAISIQDASHNFDDATSQQVCDVLNAKNYKTVIAAAPLRDKKFAFVGEGSFTIGDAADKTLDNGVRIKNYPVNFKLSFYRLPEGTICGVLSIPTKVTRKSDLPEDKEEIKSQALFNVLQELKNKPSIPVCN